MFWAIVMAGGKGTRLWPASRARQPKQFLKLFGKKTLIENTLDRLSKIIPRSHIYIITDHQHLKQTQQLFPELPKDQVIGEPVSRNTAATVALGAALIAKRNPKAVIGIFPADAAIFDERNFKKSVREAASWAAKGEHHVLFGIKPTYPATGYGYVERSKRKVMGNVFPVKRFVEKPNLAKAIRFIRNPSFYWQAGIFFWRADTILTSFSKYLPKHYRTALQIARAWKRGNSKFPLTHLFKRLETISVDYGIMEKLSAIYMVAARFGWNDIGSWSALHSIWPQDVHGNAYRGNVVSLNSKRNLVFSPHRQVCFLGVDDLIVVDTHDALLVASKDKAEQVKDLVLALQKKNLKKYL